jgi:hypothetical protein
VLPWIPAFAGMSGRCMRLSSHPVIAGHSRSKNGVLSHAYVPAIHEAVPPA